MKEIVITVTLTHKEAQAYAQFLKRVGYSDYRKLTDNCTEAHYMMDADWKLRAALIEAGFAPR